MNRRSKHNRRRLRVLRQEPEERGLMLYVKATLSVLFIIALIALLRFAYILIEQAERDH